MRQLKFRAWDDLNERWIGMSCYEDTKDPRQSKATSNFWFMVVEHDWEVMQFTGLKDKNGKEIFEGDIVNISGIIQPTKVEFKEGSFIVEGSYFKHHKLFTRRLILGALEGYVEVIGNIHENLELLKEKK